MPASMKLVWVRLPFLQPFIYTEYMESQILIHYVIYMCRVGYILYNYCHHFYNNQTAVQDNSAAHFSWWLKLCNNAFLRAALLEGSVVEHFCLGMLSHLTWCSWPLGTDRNTQRLAEVNVSRQYQSSVTVQHWGCPSQTKDKKSQQRLLTQCSQAKHTHWRVLTHLNSSTYFRYQIRKPGSFSSQYS